jgi:hypothetical protein
MVEMQKKGGLLKDRLNSELCHMNIDCSFFGGSSGNTSCANWWITVLKATELCFMLYQETMEDPKVKQQPDVLF